jgi:hypothetical protein
VNAPLVRELSWPPPPHDPRERDRVLLLGHWEIRLFGEHKFQYFVTHGFWHLQLWHEAARISVLTPSRLTHMQYEAFPIAGWKGRAATYRELSALVVGEHGVFLPDPLQLRTYERALVQQVEARSGLQS